jgi:mannose-6-phosphate isomerase-like protein (cupin superfamily)
MAGSGNFQPLDWRIGGLSWSTSASNAGRSSRVLPALGSVTCWYRLEDWLQPRLRGSCYDANGGEHLVHFRNPGHIFIKAGAATGSPNLAFGTQQVPAGAGGIPVHRHFEMDEAFYVLEGSGAFTLNNVRYPLEKGATIFIPKNAWHGFTNPDQELLLLWVVTPAGLDGFFRKTCEPPGMPQKPLTKEQLNEIARKYATEFR